MSSGTFPFIWGKTNDRRLTLNRVHVGEVILCDVETMTLLSHIPDIASFPAIDFNKLTLLW